jgi:anion-transporting  ArsA/GET3 family ATPase
VIFDAPSTGHAIPVLDLPSKVLRMVRGGAFRSHIEWVEGFLKDPEKTAVVVVSAPEEMVVGETLELVDALRSIGISVLFTAVNKVYENPFTKGEEKTILRHGRPGKSHGTDGIWEIARNHIERANTSDRHINKLVAGLKDGVLVVPKIFKKDLTAVDLKYVAMRLEMQTGGGNR